ncbi:zinc finger CCCH domain-containing protein 11A-like isoform X3 [Ascaphus truei]|uniref:zinc finger CCCH domain-containing protein 11A-like isoform X3 n=1 Tax=Ascaphus truei TaxID=8439 RepID=UPI003F59D68A
MTNQGDDCYFFFYSTCTKGESCAFRHCEAAIGNEMVCTLWQEGRCFRQVCKYRHMEIDKKRSKIPCYWENQISGCQKGNCAFHHAKGRFVDGIFLLPSKTHLPKPEPAEEEPVAAQLSLAQNKLIVAPAPQLRGVKKMEASENVPSPTHPPVVINAADDDEDDDDQFSEEGEELKSSGLQHPSLIAHQGTRVITTRKAATPKKDVGLNFGIKTLDEIKWRKGRGGAQAGTFPSLGAPGAGIDVPTFASIPLGPSHVQMVPEKDRTVVRTITFSSKNDQPGIHMSLAQRLGKRKACAPHSPLATSAEESLPPMKKSLSQRLGRRLEPPAGGPDTSPMTVQVPQSVKERLGLPAEQNSAETERATKPANEFRIKTLEEIRQEKAGQKHEHCPAGPPPRGEEPAKTEGEATSKPQAGLYIKTFSEVQAEKRQRQLKRETVAERQGEEMQKVGGQVEATRKLRRQAEVKRKVGGQEEVKPAVGGETVVDSTDSKKPPARESPPSARVKPTETRGRSQPIEQVRIKTLEEIREEKARRLQQAVKPQSVAVSQPLAPSNRKRVLRISKPSVEAKPDPVPAELSLSTPETRAEGDAANHLDKVPRIPPVSVPVKRSPEKQQERESESGTPTPLTAPERKPAGKAGRTPALVTPVPEPRDSAEAGKPTVQTSEKRTRGKPKGNVVPRVVKSRAGSKRAVKRKAPESLAVAAVRPLSPAASSPRKELTPKKATPVLAADPGLQEKPTVTDPSPKRPKESSELPTSELVSPTTAQALVKSRRLSTASAGKATLPTEDDFDKLLWEMSGGKLEAEIDLDPGKDEDDLLLELSEMIDS